MLGMEQISNYSMTKASYSVKDNSSENPLLSNKPDLQPTANLVGTHYKWSNALRLSWVDDFDWNSGFFHGPVPAFPVVDVHFGYDLSGSIHLGLNIANVGNEDHYLVFGGSILPSWALLHLTITGA